MSQTHRENTRQIHFSHAHAETPGDPNGHGSQRQSCQPDMTAEQIADEVPLRILINLAHHGEALGDCEAVDALGRHILRAIYREIDNGVADNRQAQLATFRVAHAAAVALINEYPGFVEHFRKHGAHPTLRRS